MATSEIFDCGPVLERYSLLEKEMGSRYGATSQAVVFVHYEELIAMRSLMAPRRDDALLAARVELLQGKLQRLYAMSAPGAEEPTPWRRLVRKSPPLIEYSRRHFESRYRGVSGQVLSETVRVDDGRTAYERLRPRCSYMFVVDDRDGLLVWSRPFELQDLVLGRNKATVGQVPVAHPMMVPERLRVSAAGEIVLIGEARVEMVVANIKSGHFRPPPESAAVVRDICRRRFDIADSDIDVFTLFGSSGARTSLDTGSDGKKIPDSL
ncbi:hypothetical protein OG402_14380 [Streptomyces anulatus]|uniref:hypothetical protein n=1 Tax=Streptomyces anulatus TaxID=1892 RepID=UPI002258EAB0|nr:hypothetical protein [Streptomyces anulatus]MCX4518788.1 hypothetical protein [Streptomyces anulatus]MCX4601668.1 hypothetical protein [Streptomyces anulatus]